MEAFTVIVTDEEVRGRGVGYSPPAIFLVLIVMAVVSMDKATVSSPDTPTTLALPAPQTKRCLYKESPPPHPTVMT